MIRPVFLLLAAATSQAWEVSGKVTDRAGVPIAQAQVCEQGNAANCTPSAADGAFSLSGATIRTRDAARPPAFSLDLAGGGLFLNSPYSLAAEVEWFASDGSRLVSIRRGLEEGANRLEPPASGGVRFLRVTAGSASMTWKTVLGAPGPAGEPAADRVETPLRKTAELITPAVVASKAGYKSRVYWAQNSTKDATMWIILATDADDTTYALPGTSYPATRMPPNEMTGSCKVYKCAFCYSGSQANNILGHSATGKGTWTFKNMYAPEDGIYAVTWYYYCGNNDHNGDPDCGGNDTLKTGAGCRPGYLVINGVEQPTLYQWQCFSTAWNIVHTRTLYLPFKAGNDNSMKIYSKTADVINIDRIVIKDGRP